KNIYGKNIYGNENRYQVSSGP
ncbi:MAG: hypothetical protein QOF38_852, partial [Pseudonocardiales bacterium]|nr:hypothetical protein [Pseudonocardiales bacterium]